MTGEWEDHAGFAHAHSSRCREEVERSVICGCFFCGAVVESSNILEWTDNGQTALCPKRGIDSVIADASGLPITVEFLSMMQERWFGPSRSAQ